MMMTSPASNSDPASRSFERLAEPVRRWIWRKKWTGLRDIQERAIPALIEGEEDVIITAATAGGKTEAAFLPLISRVLTSDRAQGFDLVYIGPLKALITDQFGRLEDLCETLELPVHPWHGDISASVKAKARKTPGGILLITPESLEAMFVLRGAEIPRMFGGTQAIVIDELHALLDSERGVHLRSLLTRLELTAGRRIRRIGLSATLGDMDLANAYLRPEAPDAVFQIESKAEKQELRMQLRAYQIGGPPPNVDGMTKAEQDEDRIKRETAAKRGVGEHIFAKMRGANNLVFAGSRQNVEIYADLLRQACEDNALPNEFYPHHASLSHDHRAFVEQRLKEGRLPLTALCTSTLELGIDIGDIACVGQIGAPWSVAGLKQRLGRSGRREGAASVLRMYDVAPHIDALSHPLSRLQLGLVRSIAMLELLIEGWCEPPMPDALHLSTLTHQILSVIAERGGASAQRIFVTLCERGPFRSVDQALFTRVLRQLGDSDVALIEQAPGGLLLLGREGERLVEHYGFYAVFKTPEEYRLAHNGKTLGTLPIDYLPAPGMTVIFVGRRWLVEAVHDREGVIEVTPSQTGAPPIFESGGGNIHPVVIARMRDVLRDEVLPSYLDTTATTLLQTARAEYKSMGFEERALNDDQSNIVLIATWAGTVANASLALALTAIGFEVSVYFDGFLEISSANAKVDDVAQHLHDIASGRVDLERLIHGHSGAPSVEKFHRYLNDNLLLTDALSSRISLSEARRIAQMLSGASGDCRH